MVLLLPGVVMMVVMMVVMARVERRGYYDGCDLFLVKWYLLQRGIVKSNRYYYSGESFAYKA